MRETLAADNVNRSYSLAATNISIFSFMLFFLHPKFESGSIDPLLFQATLITIGVATFSLVFATFHYYRLSLAGRINEADRTINARRADRFWLVGCSAMFLAPSLVLFLIELRAVGFVWLGLWLGYLSFVVRYFPQVQTPQAPQVER